MSARSHGWRDRSVCSVRSHRQPSVWNTFRFHIRSLPFIVTFAELDMRISTSRLNILIRTLASLTGDIAAATSVAVACAWLMKAATLGWFLSFLVWLVGALMALALSQYVIHPAVAVLLSDRKLDHAIDGLSGLGGALTQVGADIGAHVLSALRSSSCLRRFQAG